VESQKKRSRAFSVEFFPPRDEAARAKLRETSAQLAQLRLDFFSVTYGAGGSTREGTHETVRELLQRGLAVAPHLSCVGATRAALIEQLQAYRALGVRRLVALGGDIPSGMASASGEFRYAYQLVELIRAETGDHFRVEVAAYPEIHPRARSAEDDVRQFKRKIDAGADAGITQYFYNADAYFRFVDECESLGLDVPIVPGIMPITNYRQLARFSDRCGAEIPRWIRQRLESYGEDLDSIRAFGLDVTTDLCERLLRAGAPGLHFYTLNRAGPTCTVWERLGL
jgi:methylenetetrahydrofolate reductase (NADPH)